MMTSRERRLVVGAIPFVIAARLLGAQAPVRLEAAAGAGGSAFGWLPRMGVAGGMDAGSLGPLSLSWRGSVDRVSAASTSPFELRGGAQLSSSSPAAGWWIGGEMIRRSGSSGVVEQPRVASGGWRRIGGVVITVSAARRNAEFVGISQISRTSTNYFVYQDTLTGRIDSSLVTRTVHDSSRVAVQSRWAETELGLAWDGRRISTAMTVGGRFASRGVPAGQWVSASVALRLTSPLSLVVGAGTAAGGRFALDGEHRFVSLGFRVRPWTTPGRLGAVQKTTVSRFAATPVGAGRYRLTIDAPRARRVEISGDFTGWKPVALARTMADSWMLVVPLATGTHRVNLRVDGGSWIVPPGLTTMNDDFAGEVGVLVVEPAAEDGAR